MRDILWLLKKYNYILVFILLEILAFVLINNHNRYQHSVLVNFNREIAGRLYSRVEGSREYLSLRKNNEVLVLENAELRNRIEELTNLLSDSTVIAAFEADSMALAGTDSTYLFIPARIVHSTYHKQFNYITIDKGRKDGLAADMAVISDEGIVGIILESSAHFSTIIPVINRDFHLSAKVKRNDFTGILQWEGRDHLVADLNEIPYHAEIKVGDTIVTSGYSAIFPEGQFVGTIKEYSLKEGNFYEIKVNLGTDFQRLYYVDVVKNFRQEEQRELESNLN